MSILDIRRTRGRRRPGGPDPDVSRVLDVHGRLARRGSDIPLRLWDGSEVGPSDRGYRLVLNHPWSLRAMLVPGTDRAAGEAFLRDAFDVEGSMVAALRDVAELRRDGLSGLSKLAVLTDVLRLPAPPADPRSHRAAVLRGPRHTRARDRDAVQHHYDLGNDFYRLFLDEQLVYSCAYFAEGDAEDPARAEPGELDRAQTRKLELVCRKLGLEAGQRFLDVGCGWGALVLHAARHHGVRALGVTLAEEQAALARERIAAAGLADEVEIRVADYREVSGTFDAVASVGMVEHVGSDQLEGYFRTLHGLTADGGRLLNHGITTGTRGTVRELSDDAGSFVGAYVFPDGALVPTARTVQEAEDAGFEVVDVEQLRPHYSRTLRHWVHRLEAQRRARSGGRRRGGLPDLARLHGRVGHRLRGRGPRRRAGALQQGCPAAARTRLDGPVTRSR